MIQCQYINKLLRTKDLSTIILNNLNEEFFSDYKEEWKYIKEHIDKYNTIPDIETFLTKFPDFDIIDVKENINYLIEELYNDRNKRQLAKIFNKVRDLINEDKTEEAIKLYTNAANDIVTSKKIECVDILKDTSRYDKYIEKTKDFNKYYIKTGFEELDKIIGGWDREEELATIVARPGVGKSWCLQKIAIEAAKQGLTVGLYSGEMTETKVGYRVDTLISNISNTKLIHGNDDIQVQYKRYIEELPNKIKGSIKVLTPSMINGIAGVTALRAFIEKEKLDILCIDQHSLLDDDRKARNPIEKASNISKDLKTLQVLKKIPIISISQQNRVNTENGQTTSHVAQTDRISQDSTILIFLEKKEDILTLNLVKSRDSGNGAKLQYAIDLDKGIFRYIPNNKDKIDDLVKEYEEDEGEDIY